MQFSAVEIRFIVTIYLNSTFRNDLKRKYFFSKNVHSYRLCSFNVDGHWKKISTIYGPSEMQLPYNTTEDKKKTTCKITQHAPLDDLI